METYFLLFENLSFGADIPYTDHGFNQHLVIVPDLHQLSINFLIFTFLLVLIFNFFWIFSDGVVQEQLQSLSRLDIPTHFRSELLS